MDRVIISSDAAPAAVGPYSQAVKTGNLVFCSGQIPLDPKTGKFVEGGIEAQTTQCLDNLKAVLEEAGTSLAKAAKINIFLADMADFAAVNGIYTGYFASEPPARACVQVAALPLGARVEIEAIGIVD